MIVLPRLQWRPTLWRCASRTSRGRRVVMSFLLSVLVVNLVLSVGMDTIWPRLRDAEYVTRLKKLQARSAANAERPLVVTIGSSRMDHGIRPLACEHGPLLCNVSQAGAGPLQQLLYLQRLFRDGVRPHQVWLEFWPPLLHQKGEHSEFVRLDPHRLFPSDERWLRDYHPEADEIMRLMREIRRTPVYNHRQRLLSHLLPSWLPYQRRLDGWSRVDAAGWLPGPDVVTDAERDRRLAIAAKFYRPLLDAYRIDPLAERAYEEMVSECRRRGITVRLLWLPESSQFRSWYPSNVVRDAEQFLHRLSLWDSNAIIRARDWMADDQFTDGYHLTPAAAVEFTRRLLELEGSRN